MKSYSEESTNSPPAAPSPSPSRARPYLPMFLHVIGEHRIHHHLETHGKFFDAGGRGAYGSDWPIAPPLNEWYNLQCGFTRRISTGHPRLDSDRDLTLHETLRSVTINAVWMLCLKRHIGSLEPDKYADLILLDHNLLKTAPSTLAETKVFRTLVADKTIWST